MDSRHQPAGEGPVDLDRVVSVINEVECRVQSVSPDTVVVSVESARVEPQPVDTPWH